MEYDEIIVSYDFYQKLKDIISIDDVKKYTLKDYDLKVKDFEETECFYTIKAKAEYLNYQSSLEDKITKLAS